MDRWLAGVRRIVPSPFMAHLATLLLMMSLILVPLLIAGDVELRGGTGGWMVHEVAYRAMSTSRIWLGILGSALVSVAAIAAYFLIEWFKHVLRRNQG
jgi:hypothetical protein